MTASGRKLTRDMGALKARLDVPERELAVMRDSLALPKRIVTTQCRRAGFSGVCAAAMPYVAARGTPWALVPVAPRCAMQLLRVGDLVEVFDTDGWGDEGAWLRGTVYQLLPCGRFRVACLGGGMTDVAADQIRPCPPARTPIAA